MEDVAAGKLLVEGFLGHLHHADGAEVGKGCQLFAGGSREDRVGLLDKPSCLEAILDSKYDDSKVARGQEAAAEFPQGGVIAGEEEDEDESVHHDTTEYGGDLGMEGNFLTSSSRHEYHSYQGVMDQDSKT